MIRLATPRDVPAIFAMVTELARYERLEHELVGKAEQLELHLFGPRPYAQALVVTEPDRSGEATTTLLAGASEEAGGPEHAVGFALFFHTYSTFLTRPGLYLEDLFVLPAHRRRGHARALLKALARFAVERGCGRLEWSVLAWNEPAIAFYRSLGAPPLQDWRTCRLTGAALTELGR